MASRRSEAIAARKVIHQMLVGTPVPHSGTSSLQGRSQRDADTILRRFKAGQFRLAQQQLRILTVYAGEDHPVQVAFRYSITRMNP